MERKYMVEDKNKVAVVPEPPSFAKVDWKKFATLMTRDMAKYNKQENRRRRMVAEEAATIILR